MVMMAAPLGCDLDRADPPPGEPAPALATASPSATPPPSASASAVSRALDADTLRPLMAASDEELLGLVLPPAALAADPKREAFLRQAIGLGAPYEMNQGNAEIAEHPVSRQACLDGLQGVVIQTPEQRRICGGHPAMVPIHHGAPAEARACIDVFEFPNRACELPFVWAGPAQARTLCKKLGKRLCTDREWVAACRSDPEGGELSTYAYGETLDLEVCNTNKSRRQSETICDPRTVQSAYDTCPTLTDPSGSHPRCRSRLGVFDLHGNVAEIMTRADPTRGKTFSQLKGSAWFYVDVHSKPGDKPNRATYSDHCAHDPRWHVEEMSRAWHVNYHLGFRCCVDVPTRAQ